MSEPITTPEAITQPVEPTPPEQKLDPKAEKKKQKQEKKAAKNAQKAAARPAHGKKRKKKIKKLLLWLILLVAIGGFAAYKLGFFGGEGMQNTENYNTVTVARRDIQNVLSGTGTLSPADSYTVTVLASGEIIEDYFEEGDTVYEDQLLMRLDSENLDSSLERAQNNYDNAKKNLEDLKEDKADLTIYSDYTGIVKSMDLEIGDNVMQGTLITTVIDRETMLIDIPFMENDVQSIAPGQSATLTIEGNLEQIGGTVKEISTLYDINDNGVKTYDVTIAVANPGAITEATRATAVIGEASCTGSAAFYYNVNKTITAEASGKVASILKKKGDHVSAGEVVLVLESESLDDSIEKAEQTLKEATTSLKDANDAYDNYEITAPISGTVVQKNYKKGEKIGSSNGGNTLAIIYDLSSLKFDMNIDELDIDSLSVGQEVNITSDAKPGMTYTGSITNISIQGTTSNGTTYYPITVTLEDYGNEEAGSKLRPGMNIDAEIILEKAENVLAVPVDAVGRGNKVKVIKNAEAYLVTTTGHDAPNADKSNLHDGAEEPSSDTPHEATPPEGTLPSESGTPSVEAVPGEETNAPSPENRTDGERAGHGERPDSDTMPDHADFEGMTIPAGMGKLYVVPKTAEYTEVTVETGISDDDYIEILSGLEEGDLVIVESATGSQNVFGMMGMGGMGGGMPMGGMSGGAPGGMGGGMGGGGRPGM